MSGDSNIFHKDGENKQKGVRLLYKKDLDKNIVKIMPISNRFLAIKVLSDPMDTLITQAYMPTWNAEEELDQMWTSIEKMKTCKYKR